jgi:hypothetical protein
MVAQWNVTRAVCTCVAIHPPPSESRYKKDDMRAVVTCVRLADWPDAGLDMEEKLSFFRETRHAFGRTALLLSGGGGLGSFHLVSGSSSGIG